MDILHWLTTQISSNAFFNGVIGASVITGCTLWAKNLVAAVRRLFARYCTTSFSVNNEDQLLYTYVNTWLRDQKIHRSPRRVIVQRDRKDSAPVRVGDSSAEDSKFHEISDVDSYYGWYRCMPVHISFDKKERENGPVLRTVSIRFYLRSPRWLSRLSAQFAQDASSHFSKASCLTVWTCSSWGSWTPKSMPYRDLGTLCIPDADKDALIADITKFLGSYDKYSKIGKPYRRNYLLSGPAGTGKTSLVWAIATHLNKDVYVFTDLAKMKSLADSYDGIPPGSIIVYEDVDCVGANVERRKPSGKKSDPEETSSLTPQGPSLSQFLNTLDGAYSLQDTMVFLTTNFPEKLDEAITRHGRVDYSMTMGRASLSLAREYSIRMGLEWNTGLEDRLNMLAENGTILPARLQEFIYQESY
jgi:chaperone BCS1